MQARCRLNLKRDDQLAVDHASCVLTQVLTREEEEERSSLILNRYTHTGTGAASGEKEEEEEFMGDSMSQRGLIQRALFSRS